MGLSGTKHKHPIEMENSGPVMNGMHQVCCITMDLSDRLRLIAYPPEVIVPMRECIVSIWGKIQSERPYFGSHEFKLKGSPWHSDEKDSVRSRRLLAEILTVMARHGWNLLQAASLSNIEWDKDSLFFEKGNEDAHAILFAVSFNMGMGDRIRIIDAPELFPYLKQAVMGFWPRGIQSEREYDGSLELKLAGYPWYNREENAIHSKLMLAHMIANFRSVGYKLYASVDINYFNDGMDTLLFRKVGENWQ